MAPAKQKQHPQHPDLDAAIAEVLAKYPSLSQETISVLLEASKWRICKRLRNLEKWKKVVRCSHKCSDYWSLPKRKVII